MIEFTSYGTATSNGIINEVFFTLEASFFDYIFRRELKEVTFIKEPFKPWRNKETGLNATTFEDRCISAVIMRTRMYG